MQEKNNNISTLQVLCLHLGLYARRQGCAFFFFLETWSQRIQPIFKLFLKVRQWRNLYRRARASRCITLIPVFVL